jgi:hypothetical protein
MKQQNRRAETARINGAMSEGPVTPEGKAKSAGNSLKHGLSSNKIVVLATENQEDCDILFNEFIELFHPVNTPERELVDQMVSARWRMRRLRSMETEIFDMRVEEHGMFNKERHEKRTPERKQAVAFQSLANTTQTLTQLTRYESRLERSYERAVDSLNKLRAQPQPPTEPRPVGSEEPQTTPTVVYPQPAPQTPAAPTEPRPELASAQGSGEPQTVVDKTNPTPINWRRKEQ